MLGQVGQRVIKYGCAMPISKHRFAGEGWEVLRLDMIIACPQGRLIDYSGTSMKHHTFKYKEAESPGSMTNEWDEADPQRMWKVVEVVVNQCSKCERVRSSWRRDLSMAMS